jgi:predicted ATP-grasp superfamily ATP-dependent carboligase
VRLEPNGVPKDGSWLVKPLGGTHGNAGGARIARWHGKSSRDSGSMFYQEYVRGDPCAALYVADGAQAHLLGVTQQLVGEPWLHAAPFRYCGSAGPLQLDEAKRKALSGLGDAVTAACGLRGLFGIDCIIRDGAFWPVEINPRYTASVEVVERATGLHALALHRAVFEPHREAKSPTSEISALHSRTPACIGKAVLFARQPLVFPPDGPWTDALRQPAALHAFVPFADIPRPGQPIGRGKPVLSFFATEPSLDACRYELQHMAAELDRWLFRP